MPISGLLLVLLLLALQRYRTAVQNMQTMIKSKARDDLAIKSIVADIIDQNRCVTQFLKIDPSSVIIAKITTNKSWLSDNIANYKQLLSSGKSFSIINPYDIMMYKMDWRRFFVSDPKIEAYACKYIDAYYDGKMMSHCGDITHLQDILFMSTDAILLYNANHYIDENVEYVSLANIQKVLEKMASNTKQMQQFYLEIDKIQNNVKKKKK